MSTNTETIPSTIEHLDFPTPCQHTQHDNLHVDGDPAAYIVKFRHDCGIHRPAYALCKSGWQRMDYVKCPPQLGGCGANGLPRHEVLTIVEVL